MTPLTEPHFSQCSEEYVTKKVLNVLDFSNWVQFLHWSFSSTHYMCRGRTHAVAASLSRVEAEATERADSILVFRVSTCQMKA